MMFRLRLELSTRLTMVKFIVEHSPKSEDWTEMLELYLPGGHLLLLPLLQSQATEREERFLLLGSRKLAQIFPWISEPC